MAGYNEKIFGKMAKQQKVEEEKEVKEAIQDYEEQSAAQKEIATKFQFCMFANESCVGQNCKECPTGQDDDLDDFPPTSQCPINGELCPYCPPGEGTADCKGCAKVGEAGYQQAVAFEDEGNVERWTEKENPSVDNSSEPRKPFRAECHPANCPACDFRDMCDESSTKNDGECRSKCNECPDRCDISKEMEAQATKLDQDSPSEEPKHNESSSIGCELGGKCDICGLWAECQGSLDLLEETEAAQLKQEEDKDLKDSWKKTKQEYEQEVATLTPDERRCELECELCASGCAGCPAKNLEDFPPVDRLQS